MSITSQLQDRIAGQLVGALEESLTRETGASALCRCADMENLLARHRKEQKELQGKITSKKKSATKKTRKGVNDECERLEHELKERQQAEIQTLAPSALEHEAAQLKLNCDNGSQGGVENGKSDQPESSVQDSPGQSGVTGSIQQNGGQPQTQQKRANRQKARLAKRAAEHEAQMEAAAAEAASMPDRRKQELSAMKTQMEKHGLIETVIRPDGHCLYSACAHTISTDKVQDFRGIRRAAADFMNAHPDDFAPFMEEPIESYSQKIKDTAEWGGHLELQAIAKAFSININVLQADGHVEKIMPEESSVQEIWLAYYKHSFGLGEHYNALTKAAAE